jgi:4-alpha-glucanotransferase
MKIHFYIRFHTTYGQSLFVIGNHEALGNNDTGNMLALSYLNDDFWYGTIEADKNDGEINYKYILRDPENGDVFEWGNDRSVHLSKILADEIYLTDTWNHAGEIDNVFFTKPFIETLLHVKSPKIRIQNPKVSTHIFKVKAPLLQPNEVLCIAGSGRALGDWNTEEVALMVKEDNWWTCKMNLAKETFPVAYKYGIYNIKESKFIRYEEGNNRVLYDNGGKKKISIMHDGFAQLPNNTWKGAGVAIPVFSLRTENGFGVGEFNDIKALADWAKAASLKLIQLLPVNDTTANHTWTDSYPYAPISVYALHPIYINLDTIAGTTNAALIKALSKKKKQLNEMDVLDYEQVMKFKRSALQELYTSLGKETFASEGYKTFFKENKHWLVPYAAFCYFRDKYATPDFSKWKSHHSYNAEAIKKLSSPSQKHYHEIAIHYFIQYHLHLQLKDAVNYAHQQGVIIKGDLPIGIYRNSADAWQQPELYNMDAQAGAPPDDFAVKGQNWGFPTYNWHRMQQDGFSWWKKRFEQMSHYFDAFRIDHILGFFRIWSIPLDAVEGIMGRFVPAIPVHINEFHSNAIWFDHHRYCKPHINDAVLGEVFAELADKVRSEFLQPSGNGLYDLKQEFDTQRKVEAWFDAQEDNQENKRLRHGLYDLISNVILFEHPGSNGQEFHFRISMEGTSSFRQLDFTTQQRLKDLYVNYFFRRQDSFWKKEAMNKLPALKRATNMLVCGEDLGMVPDCVPDVMKQLGLLSLEIQRMPKDPKKEFFHPADAPYLSVVTPSTHDMSTLRGWWEEDYNKTQKFYNTILGQYGKAPYYCEPWIAKSIVIQHLYSPAMWSIFQLQDLFAIHEGLRRENPHDERINVPANPKHYWRYRMHVSIEDLLTRNDFTEELSSYIKAAGR